jgi:hypothetical protein
MAWTRRLASPPKSELAPLWPIRKDNKSNILTARMRPNSGDFEARTTGGGEVSPFALPPCSSENAGKRQDLSVFHPRTMELSPWERLRPQRGQGSVQDRVAAEAAPTGSLRDIRGKASTLSMHQARTTMIRRPCGLNSSVEEVRSSIGG